MADRPFDVIDVEQRSAEWYAARCGILTASEAAILFAQPRKGATESVQRRDLRTRLAIERITGQPAESDDLNAADVRRGRELEPEARATYEAHTGALAQTVGLLKAKALPIGCSPDGIVGDYAGGVELKAPKPAIHLGYLCDPSKLFGEYGAQITHSLFVSGLPYWDLVSYCQALPESLRLCIVRTTREEVDLAAYELVVRTFLKEVDGEEARIRLMAEQRAAEGVAA